MKKLVLILLIVGCTGCAMKSYSHLGVSNMGDQSLLGVVSKGSANEFDEFVFRFHKLVNEEKYQEAYALFSDDLKAQTSLEKFIEEEQQLVKDFGKEKDFKHLYYKAASILPSFDEAVFQDAFKYYNSVIGAYRSYRNSDVAYEFHIARKNGELKILGVTFGPCDLECKE